VSASKNQLSPNGYGMRSGGTTPSMRSMTKNGAPSARSSVSSQTVVGMATSVRAATNRIALYCRGMSYTGKTGSDAGSGGSRNTNRRDCSWSSASDQWAWNKIVSLDMPLVAGAMNSEIVGFDRCVPIHCVSCSRSS
jgi:hypothetical protein